MRILWNRTGPNPTDIKTVLCIRCCGRLFCSECSEQSVPIPQEQLYSPVRHSIYHNLHRQTDRWTDRQTDRWTDKQLYSSVRHVIYHNLDRQTDRRIDIQTDKESGTLYTTILTDRQIDRQMDRCTDRTTILLLYWQTDGQTYRKIDR
jgi:hypothetical protein